MDPSARMMPSDWFFYTQGLILEAAVVLLIIPLLLLHVHMSQLGKFLIIWSIDQEAMYILGEQ